MTPASQCLSGAVAYLVGAVFGLLLEDPFGANIGGAYASVIRSWDCVVGCAL
jgi:hypothetical protein